MPHLFRRAFPYLALGLLGVALVWATSFGTLPPADFAFQNGNELETIDPALATGQPEHRVLNALFEGLLRNEPPDDWQALDGPGKNVPITPRPAAAEDFSVSDDGLTYTFQMRKDAKWTDGSPVTADDFAWSWRRTLHPETGARYGYQLYYIAGAQHYNLAQVDPGDRVEVELPDRRDPLQPFPRGTILRGVLRSLHKPPQPVLPPTATDKQTSDAEVAWKKKWVYVVEVKPQREGQVDWEAAGRERRFSKEPGGGRCDYPHPGPLPKGEGAGRSPD